MAECCLLACSSGLFNLLLHKCQDHVLSGNLTRSELGTLTSVINQENTPSDFTPEQSGRGIFSIKVFFKMTLVCVKLVLKKLARIYSKKFYLSLFPLWTYLDM